MEKRKINIIITGVSYLSTGASPARVRNLFSALEIDDNITINNIVITSPETDNQLIIKPNNTRIVARFITYSITNPFSFFGYFIKCFSYLKEMKLNGADNILYVYGFPDLENITLIAFSKLFKYKIVFDIIENNYTFEDFRRLRGKIKTFSSHFLFKHISLFADGAIAISTNLKRLLENFSKGRIPVELIPISVDFSNFPSDKPMKNHDIKLFYGGSFAETDNLNLLLEAFSIVSKSREDIKLVLTGKGAERHLKILLKLIDNNPSRDKIIFRGFLSNKEYYETINECDIMCVTRSGSAFANGGFPFKLGDYLGAGKATIVSDVSDIGYYIRDKVNAILIKPDSVEDIVQAIELLIQDTNLRLRIGEEGRKTAKIFFDQHRITERFLSFIMTKVVTENKLPTQYHGTM